MKQFLESSIALVLQSICLIVSYIYTYNVHKLAKRCRNLLFTYWSKRQLSMLGKHSRICVGCEITGGKKIVIGANTIVEKNTILAVQKSCKKQLLKVGDNVTIGESSNFSCFDKIEIGNDVLFGRRVTIIDNSHGFFNKEYLSVPPRLRHLESKGPIIIGDKCWIGEKVTILSGVTIGRCSVIGAGAVVTKSIPPYSLAVGVPAKVIKTLK